MTPGRLITPVLATMAVATMACNQLPLNSASNQQIGSSTPASNEVGGSTSDITSLTAAQTNLAVGTGQQDDLALYLRTQNGSIPTSGLLWQSSDTSIGYVDQNGNLKGIGAGSVVITATVSSNPSIQAQFHIVVQATPLVTDIKVTPSNIYVNQSHTVQLQAEVDMPDGEVNGNVAWSSSDSTIAAINQTTGTVTGVKPGKTTILAAYNPDNQYVGLADITVLAPGQTPPPSPSPSPVVFGPGYSTSPSPSFPNTTPTPRPTATATPNLSQTPIPVTPDGQTFYLDAYTTIDSIGGTYGHAKATPGNLSLPEGSTDYRFVAVRGCWDIGVSGETDVTGSDRDAYICAKGYSYGCLPSMLVCTNNTPSGDTYLDTTSGAGDRVITLMNGQPSSTDQIWQVLNALVVQISISGNSNPSPISTRDNWSGLLQN